MSPEEFLVKNVIYVSCYGQWFCMIISVLGLKIHLCSLYVKYRSHLCCVFTAQVLNQDLEELSKAHYTVSRKGLTSACIHYMEKRSTHPFPLDLHSYDNRRVQL